MVRNVLETQNSGKFMMRMDAMESLMLNNQGHLTIVERYGGGAAT